MRPYPSRIRQVLCVGLLTCMALGLGFWVHWPRIRQVLCVGLLTCTAIGLGFWVHWPPLPVRTPARQAPSALAAVPSDLLVTQGAPEITWLGWMVVGHKPDLHEGAFWIVPPMDRGSPTALRAHTQYEIGLRADNVVVWRLRGQGHD